jgi:hypothetical protein
MVEHVPELIESLLLQPQRRRRRIRSIRFEGPVHSLVTSILTHCQLHLHRKVQEDVSELLIHFIHG